MTGILTKFVARFQLKKRLNAEHLLQTKLDRCVGTVYLIIFTISSIIGGDIWYLSGYIVKSYAGPAAIISFALAGIAAYINALCYVELAAQVPRAGGTYLYAYMLLGEFIAFVVAWLVITADIVSMAYQLSILTEYLDTLVGGEIKSFYALLFSWWPSDIYLLKSYPDLLAFFLMLVVTAICCFRVNVGNFLSGMLMAFVLATLTLTSVLLLTKADISNWISVSGGFAPYGLEGIFKGVSYAFVAYVGLDGFVELAEETKDAKKSFFKAVNITMAIVNLAYILPMLALTLAVPYYSVNSTEGFQNALESLGFSWAATVIYVGAIFTYFNNTLVSLVYGVRLCYAMAKDKLLPQVFGSVCERTQTPLKNTIIIGICTSICALLFDVTTMINIMSVSMNMTYSLSAAMVMILRITPPENYPLPEQSQLEKHNCRTEYCDFRCKSVSPAKVTLVTCLPIIALFLAAWYATTTITRYGTIGSCGLLFICGLTYLSIQRQTLTPASYQVPCVPWVPALSLVVNIAQIGTFDGYVWVQMAVLTGLGVLVYIVYAIYKICDGHDEEDDVNLGLIEEMHEL